MKKPLIFIVCLLVAFSLQTGWAAEKAPQELIDFGKTELVKWGLDPVIVKAVKAENAKNKTLDDIKTIDKKWQATPGVDSFMRAMMESECGKHLRDIQKSKPYYDEIFVMDKLGANVAMTDKTSDYWQGDEDKFTKSFNKGKGGIHVGDISFDESAQSYLVQISVPVKDIDPETKKETIIGAITIGVNIDKFK